jgi:hypothetical protein
MQNDVSMPFCLMLCLMFTDLQLKYYYFFKSNIACYEKQYIVQTVILITKCEYDDYQLYNHTVKQGLSIDNPSH